MTTHSQRAGGAAAPCGRPDLLAVGEVNVDLVSHDLVDSVADAGGFGRQLGGGPANVAVTVARLGGRAAVAARVGDDGFGRFAVAALDEAGVDTTAVTLDGRAPTTTAVIARSRATPDFLVHRGADALLEPDDLPGGLARALHTSAFALSRSPAREAALAALARSAGSALTSLDPGYHPRVWGRDTDPFPVLEAACRHADVVKPSSDDCRRLFGPAVRVEEAADRFLEWGAGAVLLTLGPRGVALCTRSGDRVRLPAPAAAVEDVNGAGDAFLAGALLALLDGYGLEGAARAGLEVARRKVDRTGHLPGPVDRTELYRAAGLVPAAGGSPTGDAPPSEGEAHARE